MRGDQNRSCIGSLHFVELRSCGEEYMSTNAKTVLITGASSGIGYDVARGFLEKGCLERTERVPISRGAILLPYTESLRRR